MTHLLAVDHDDMRVVCGLHVDDTGVAFAYPAGFRAADDRCQECRDEANRLVDEMGADSETLQPAWGRE